MSGPGGAVRVVSPDARVPDLTEALAAALHGGEALLPLPGGAPGAAVRAAAALDDDEHPVAAGTALLLPTSGSTGTPKVVELSAGALRASAQGTAAVLGGGARWLLALPLVHVAAWQVLVRSVLAGTDPVVLGAARFTAGAFADAVEAMDGARRATSLVPTQLARVVADERARAAAASLDAVLVGGASCPAPLLAAAREAGVRAVTTYGSTETSGGCVYDGVALPGVRVRVEDGRVLLAGPVLASGYRGQAGAVAAAGAADAGGFVRRGPARWYATPDTGRLEGGQLVVTGRADDVVVTGGVNVAPVAVEDAIAALPGVAQVVVVGVPDERWGAAVTALVVPEGRPPAPGAVRAAVRERLGDAAAPRRVLVVADVPARALGKPDRRAAAAVAAAAVAADPCAGLG